MKSKPRICILTPGLSHGGAQKVAVNLANEWNRLGLPVELLVLKARGVYFDDVDPDVNINVFGVKKIKYSLVALSKYLIKTKPDIVFSVIRDTNIIAGFLSLFIKDIKFYGREANTMDAIFYKNFISRFFYLNSMKFLYKRLDGVIANSAYTLDDLIKNNIFPSSSCIIGNPVISTKSERLLKEKVSDDWLNSSDIRTIINIGRLSKQKNHPLLINAFFETYKKNKNLRLIILGEGEEENNLRSLIKKHKLEDAVKIIPFQRNVYKYLRYSDIFVLSSIYEGFGNVVVEALFSETEVVLTKCPGGAVEIIKNGSLGTLVENNNVQSLTNGILNALSENRSDRSSMLKERALYFNVVDMSQKYLDFISK